MTNGGGKTEHHRRVTVVVFVEARDQIKVELLCTPKNYIEGIQYLEESSSGFCAEKMIV